jgi:hypothetical protein
MPKFNARLLFATFQIKRRVIIDFSNFRFRIPNLATYILDMESGVWNFCLLCLSLFVVWERLRVRF